MKPAAAIFDLDGLMLDTERPFITALAAKNAESGWDVPFDTLIKIIGINCRASEKLLKDMLGSEYPFMDLRSEILRHEKTRYEAEGIPHKPGLIPLLDSLREKKIPAAVATSTDRDRALWKLRCGGILERFDAIVCGDEIQHGKPAPDIFLRAAEKLALPAACCAGLEDSPAGLTALAAAGIRSIFIKDMIEPDAEVRAAVWKCCSSLYEVIPLF
jgi:HAD superfamily hydrolase (TIGR01509 family)